MHFCPCFCSLHFCLLNYCVPQSVIWLYFIDYSWNTHTHVIDVTIEGIIIIGVNIAVLLSFVDIVCYLIVTLIIRPCNSVLWELQQAVQSLMKECKKHACISSEYDEMCSQHNMRGITNLVHNTPTHPPLPNPE